MTNGVGLQSLAFSRVGTGPLGEGGQVAISLAVATPVMVSGAPRLMLSNGATAVYDAAASTATNLVFDYTVGFRDATADLKVTGLVLDGGVIDLPGALALAGFPTSHFGDSKVSSLALADLNSDGKLDVVETNYTYIEVRFGNGDGTFKAGPSYLIATVPSFDIQNLAVADVNGDGKPDIVFSRAAGAANYYAGVTVLLTDGNGAISAFASYIGGIQNTTVSAADLNGDGRPDLVLGDAQGAVDVLLNDGKGGFGPATAYNSASQAGFVTLADVNGDGKVDAIVANFVNGRPSGGVSILLGKGDGTFGAPTTFFSSLSIPKVVAADLNGDGRPDLVFRGYTAPVYLSDIFTSLNDGKGGFGPLVDTGIQAYQFNVADMNGDGALDLVAPDLQGQTNISLGNGVGGFSQPTTFSTEPLSGSNIALGDFNGDGRPDILSTFYAESTYVDDYKMTAGIFVTSNIIVQTNTSTAQTIDPAAIPATPGADSGLAIDTSGGPTAVASLTQLYQDEFSRAPTATELGILEGYLRAGLTLANIRHDSANLTEAQFDLHQDFTYVLNREPTAAELAAATQALASGDTTQALLRAALAAGAESQANLNQFSRDILGHAITPALAAAETQRLAQGASLGIARTDLAISAESQAAIVATTQRLLGRDPTAAESQADQVQLASGLDQAAITFQTIALASQPSFIADTPATGLLRGTPGVDLFGVGANTSDIVVGFDYTHDMLQISRAQLPDYAAFVAAETTTPSGVQITLDAGHSVLLQGVAAAQVFVANLRFV